MNAARNMPVIFIGHGSPTNVLEDNEATRGWERIAGAIPRPRAILCISAHWCTRGTAVTAMARPRTIHDFGPLSPKLFEMQYPAPGSPELAARVRDLLAPEPVTLDDSWGLDHGTWAVLLKAFPGADVPVVQLSMDVSKSPEWRVEMGRRLQPLREEGVLVLGSGNIVHNLRIMEWNNAARPYDWAERFNAVMKQYILDGNTAGVCNYPNEGEDAVLAVPNPDHFWPLLYTLGARRSEDSVTLATDFIVFKSLGMTSCCFSTPAVSL